MTAKAIFRMAQDPSMQVCGPYWKQLKCGKTLCSAHSKWETPCWLVLNNLCGEHRQSDYTGEFERCLACQVFKAHAETDSRGWHYFVSDQLKCLTRNVLKEASQREKDAFHILDNLPDGLFAMDKEGRINYFNPVAERITGISASDAMGMHCKQIFKTTTWQIGGSHEKSGRIEKNIYNKEFVVTTLDGRILSIISSISVLRDHSGNVIGGIQVFKDISDRKRLEGELRLSESKYRRIFEGSKDMIFITSKDGLIRDVNQASVDLMDYGSKQDLLSPFSIEAVFDNPMHWQVFKRQIDRHGFVQDFEAGLKKKDGTRMHCLLSGNAVRKENGEITGYEGIVKDITARMDAIGNLRKRHRELSLLNAVALVMNATQDLDEILMTALVKVLAVLNLTSGGIFLIDHEKSVFSLYVQKGLSECFSDNTYQMLLHDRLLRESLFKKNLSLEPKPIFPSFTASLKGQEPSRSVRLTCFLITAKEKASGFIALKLPSDKKLTNRDLRLLGSLGNFLGGAIENTRLILAVQKHREDLKDLTAKLFHSQEDERRRIARELHDEAGQALTGISFTMETIEKSLSAEPTTVKQLISDVSKQINRTYRELRRISYRLHPAILSDLGLKPALDAYLTNITKHRALNIDFNMVGFKGRIDAEVETALYRLSQETLTNTVKYSRARNFNLFITKSFPNIIFLAEDDGVGFDPEQLEGRKQALGLLSMRERASMLGGKFFLRTAPGRGTRIRIEIPVKENRRE